MTQVFIVTAAESSYDRMTIEAVLDTRTSAERWIEIQGNKNPDSNAVHTILGCTVQTVSDEEYTRDKDFFDLVDSNQWYMHHELVQDDAYIGNIKQRRTCKKCGSSIVQFEDGTIRDNTAEKCPVA